MRLNVNELPHPPPDGWREELANALATVCYPDRTARELRMAIAECHSVRADQVFAANGSNEVLQTLLLTYGGPGAHGRDVRADLPTPPLKSWLYLSAPAVRA